MISTSVGDRHVFKKLRRSFRKAAIITRRGPCAHTSYIRYPKMKMCVHVEMAMMHKCRISQGIQKLQVAEVQALPLQASRGSLVAEPSSSGA